MAVPFTPAEFLDGFGRFNTAVWPLHVAALGVTAGVVVLAFRGGRRASRIIAFGLASMWLASAALQAVAFHDVMPTTAIPFAAAFLLQAALLALAGTRERLAFAVRRGPGTVLGLALVAYAAFAYPAIGALSGHSFPRMPVFGMAPCPNAIFTFGLLLLTERPVPRWILPIPALWSLVGISAAAALGIVEDWGLPVAGASSLALLAVRDRWFGPRRSYTEPGHSWR